MAREKIEAATDPFFEAALYHVKNHERCRSRAAAVRAAIVMAARQCGWKGTDATWHGDFRWESRAERLARGG